MEIKPNLETLPADQQVVIFQRHEDDYYWYAGVFNEKTLTFIARNDDFPIHEVGRWEKIDTFSTKPKIEDFEKNEA